MIINPYPYADLAPASLLPLPYIPLSPAPSSTTSHIWELPNKQKNLSFKLYSVK